MELDLRRTAQGHRPASGHVVMTDDVKFHDQHIRDASSGRRRSVSGLRSQTTDVCGLASARDLGSPSVGVLDTVTRYNGIIGYSLFNVYSNRLYCY